MQSREVIAVEEKVLGPNHPDTLDYQKRWQELRKGSPALGIHNPTRKIRGQEFIPAS